MSNETYLPYMLIKTKSIFSIFIRYYFSDTIIYLVSHLYVSFNNDRVLKFHFIRKSGINYKNEMIQSANIQCWT